MSVVDSGGETPGPIPNPEAKPARADGTAPGREWESRLPPTQQLHTQTPVGKTQPVSPTGVFTYTHMIVVADNSNIGAHPPDRNTESETLRA